MNTEQVSFEVGGETVPGRLETPDDPTDDALLMLPGAGHGPYGDIFDRLVEEATGADVACLRYRSWESRDELDEKTLGDLQAELRAALDLLAGRGYADLTLGGKSYGGVIALSDVPDAVSRLFLWAPALAVEDEGNLDEAETTPVGEFDRLQTDEDGLDARLSDVDVPVRILHGDRDHIPLKNSERIADALPDAEVIEIEGADHSFGVAQLMRTVGHTVEFVEDD